MEGSTTQKGGRNDLVVPGELLFSKCNKVSRGIRTPEEWTVPTHSTPVLVKVSFCDSILFYTCLSGQYKSFVGPFLGYKGFLRFYSNVWGKVGRVNTSFVISCYYYFSFVLGREGPEST